MPPMVGVPALEKCDFGPSSRTTCPTLPKRSFSIIQGPSSKPSASAVITAKIARTVRYEKRLNPEKCGVSCLKSQYNIVNVSLGKPGR